jgi:hypothetical protein
MRGEKPKSVTKRDGEGYEDFVRRAVTNPIGRCVKLADLHDNSLRTVFRDTLRSRAISLIGAVGVVGYNNNIGRRIPSELLQLVT